MSIEIIIPPSLQSLTGDADIVTVTGGSVRESLEQLAGLYPAIKPHLFTSQGELAGGLSIFVNKVNIYPGELAGPVSDGDRIYLSYIVMGG